jgi:hypothetical protein
MKRIIATGLVAVLTAGLASCGKKEKTDPPPGPSPASKMFDMKSPPKKQKGANPG